MKLEDTQPQLQQSALHHCVYLNLQVCKAGLYCCDKWPGWLRLRIHFPPYISALECHCWKIYGLMEIMNMKWTGFSLVICKNLEVLLPKIALAGKQFEIIKLVLWLCVVWSFFDPLCKRRKLKLVIPIQIVNSATFNLFEVVIRWVRLPTHLRLTCCHRWQKRFLRGCWSIKAFRIFLNLKHYVWTNYSSAPILSFRKKPLIY